MKELESTRTLCEILEDMRKCCKTLNFSYMNGLIEEAQYRGNRMENAIDRMKEMDYSEERRIGLKKEIKELEKRKVELKEIPEQIPDPLSMLNS